MEDVLRWSLLVVGSCVIAGVLVHGLWVSRKNSNKSAGASKKGQPTGGKPEYQSEKPADESGELNIVTHTIDINMDDDWDPETQPPFFSDNKTGKNEAQQGTQFDALGLGTARAVSPASPNFESETTINDPPTPEEGAEQQSQGQTTNPSASDTEQGNIDKPKMYASVVTRPKPEYTSTYQSSGQKVRGSSLKSVQGNGIHQARADRDVPSPPASLLKKTSAASTQAPEKSGTAGAEPMIGKTVDKGSQNTGAKRKGPKFAENQLSINFEDDQVNKDAQRDEELRSDKTPATAPVEVKQEVLVLNVKAPEDKPVAGSVLLPMLLTLGFKFGDQDIFHRHVNANGKGPVLFSLANMFKPGNFDIDNLENFNTQGVSLFMILPIEGDPHQVFNMMHNAARKIADELGAQILDGHRVLLTKQSLQQYVERIRDFQRQRAIQGQ
ncbi:MAG: cell division protein ZipA [Paraglaciecola sp.]|jgi:cell division protein ZipA